jgi:hypothetical protein
MADGVNWGVADPGSVGYDVSPQGPNWSPLINALKPNPQPGQGQQPGQQPGQPLNIQSQAQMSGPSWFDRLRSYFSGTSPQAATPNPNPPVSTDVGVPGPGPATPPANTPLTQEDMDSYILRQYGISRQAGGPVVPGYAGGVMGAMQPRMPMPAPAMGGQFPMAGPMLNRFGNPSPGYTAGGNIV